MDTCITNSLFCRPGTIFQFKKKRLNNLNEVKIPDIIDVWKKASIENGHWDNPEEWMGREVGGGFRMGNTCPPVADACQCMAKTTTIL